MRDFNKLSKSAYNKKANKYNKTIDGKFTAAFKKQLIANIKVRENDKILDVACGTGELLYRLAKAKIVTGFGIDNSDQMISVAKETYPNLNYKTGDSAVLDFEADFFDIITVSASFHHFPEPQKFIAEATRTLKDGGKIYIAEVYAPLIIRQILNIFLPLSNSGDVKIYSANEIFKMFKNNNLTNFKVTKSGYVQIISAEKHEHNPSL